jgi:NADH:ubiquinone oxidoreductase subunit E/NAD-dependent dihydropyrimidine dehydrogenase PreA subunit
MSERIGVYICHCGTNISHTVDTAAVAEFARALPEVVVVREYKYMCSDPGQELIRKDIGAERLTRVVVSSCSPLMHEETFRTVCEDAGLNRFLFQMANIREQCSWVHEDRAAATAKAKQLVGAAVRRVVHHRPMTRREVPVRPEAIVIGGGIAGIEAALRLADSGKKVYLVEREPSIGGHMARFDKTFPTLDCAACILTPKMVQVGQHPNIEILSYSEVEEVSGHVGDFHVKVRRKARYVDESKCTGCGQCLERCPVRFEPGPSNGVHRPEPGSDLESWVKDIVDRAVDLHRHERGPLVSVLQDINEDLGYLPAETLRYVSSRLQMPLSRVYHVATFYKAFSLTPRGEHVIKVCVGTACHVRGSARVVEALEQRLGVKAGQTTEDMKFTLETVNCLGACAMGPVVVVDGRYQTVRPSEVNRLVDKAARETVAV